MGGQDPQGNYLDTLETFDVETKTVIKYNNADAQKFI